MLCNPKCQQGDLLQGDDYVDWVGMSLYHFGTIYPYDRNVLPEARKFTSTVSRLFSLSLYLLLDSYSEHEVF